MRSTGICVWDGKVNNYILICSNPTRKVLSFRHPRFLLYMYEPEPTKDKSGIQKEMAKTENVTQVVGCVRDVIKSYKPNQIRIESVALHGSGLLDELAGLNYCIRLVGNKVCPVYPITPSSNKMEFVGHGGATKDMMVDGWAACEVEADTFIKELGRHAEDLADAYALCHYPGSKILS